MVTESGLLRVTMLSDWSIGSGRGVTGGLDSVVQTDDAGLPYLPAKTLTGVWRDAAEQLATALDSDLPDRPWRRWLVWLFGAQPSQGETFRSAALSVRPARYPEHVRRVLAGHPEVREGLFVERAAVALDENGIAREGHLRFEQRVRAGATLEAPVEVALEPARWPAALLLLGAAAMVDRVGGNRRRGAGRCTWEVHLPGWELTQLISRAELEPSPPRPPAGAPTSSPKSEKAEGRTGDRRVEVTLTALTPLLVGVRARGNDLQGGTSVPGATLLPLVAQAVPGLRSGLAQHRVFVSDAMLAVEGVRGLPSPRLWQTRLGDSTAFSAFTDRRVVGKTAPLTGAVNPPELWSQGLRVSTPRFSTRAHAVIADDAQRPTEDSGGLFVTTALQAGTTLVFEIILRDGEPVDPARLDGTWRMGVSSKDDYGLVQVAVSSDEPVPPGPAEIPAGRDVILWLTSDLVLPATWALDGGVEDYVRASVAKETEAILAEPEDRAPTARIAAVRRDTFHTAWGLGRPTLSLAQAGGCVRAITQTPLTQDARRRLAHMGVGARRGEGFGRIVVLDTVRLPISLVLRHDTASATEEATSGVSPRPLNDPRLAAHLRAAARAAVVANIDLPRPRATPPWLTSEEVDALVLSERERRAMALRDRGPGVAERGGGSGDA